jgi:DNA repair exonuclease SbcCD ATPase subunit
MSRRYVPVAQRRAQEVRAAAQAQAQNAAQKLYDDREERVHALLEEAKTIAGKDTPMFARWLDDNKVGNYGDRTKLESRVEDLESQVEDLESQVEALESHKDSFEEISFSVHGSSILDRSVVEIWNSASTLERIQIEDFFKGFLASRVGVAR